MDLTWALTGFYFLNNDEINYGIEVQGFKTDFEYFNYAKRQINQTEKTLLK